MSKKIPIEKKIAISGTHGVGKSTICKKVASKLLKDPIFGLRVYKKFSCFVNGFELIPEQYSHVVANILNFTKQTEEVTLATYGRQLYLENLYTAIGSSILCDRSVLDTFIYYDYFTKPKTNPIIEYFGELKWATLNNTTAIKPYICMFLSAVNFSSSYDKIYLIEPSDRKIESDGFRLTDKKQQLEIHDLFIKHFQAFENVIIINQEDQDNIVDMIVNDFNS